MAMPDGWILPEDTQPAAASASVFSHPYRVLTTAEQWENFTNEVAVDFERRLRELLGMMKRSPKAYPAQKRRFTLKMLWERLYGEEYPKWGKGYKVTPLREIAAYYSSRIVRDTNINGKRYKCVYVLSTGRLKKRPWCIKLRIEWYQEHGEEITEGNTRVIHKKLKAGQARNPRTQANMEKRSAKARQIYNEKYNTKAYKEDLQKRKQEEQIDE